MARREVFLAFAGFSMPFDLDESRESEVREMLDRVIENKVKGIQSSFWIGEYKFCSHALIGFAIRDYQENLADVQLTTMRKIRDSMGEGEEWRGE